MSERESMPYDLVIKKTAENHQNRQKSDHSGNMPPQLLVDIVALHFKIEPLLCAPK